jgi:UDP-glucose 4-epimerase
MDKQMNILITGSAGFLGAPLAYDLLKIGHNIIGIDNYSNSNSGNTKKLKKSFAKNYKFYELDIALKPNELNAIFLKHDLDLVIHLAALKSVYDSISYPGIYIKNNINSTLNVLASMELSKCKKIIYSSSAAVYGNQKTQPINENGNLKPMSTYAETKLSCEQLIENACNTIDIDGISLRYFNPIGYHSSKLFKELLIEGTGNIMQEIVKVALKRTTYLNIYGNDYLTNDGTCERDFIHIDDVLGAHIESIKYIKSIKGYDVFNVGTGKPVSILELIDTFKIENKVSIKYEFVEKRSGDIQSCYADVSKIKSKIKWSSKKDLKTMVRDSWEAYSKEYNKG